MSIEAAVDNDVLIKCACYDLLEEVIKRLGGPGSAGILGAARYVVGDQLRRHSDIQNSDSAQEHFATFLETAIELEPSDDELEIATKIEEVAMSENLPLDEGESQLCAIVVYRSVRALITGDKRAVESLEVVMGRVNILDQLEQRLASLEQLVLALAKGIGASAIRSRVCAEPLVDKTLSICFECWQLAEPQEFEPVGLKSYINDLRLRAPTVLHPDGTLFTS